MLKETYEVTQSGRVVSCEKIAINKYENKLTCLHFNYDNQIADGRKYIAILNPKTKRYRILLLSLDDTVTLSTDISRYPGIWQLILLVTEDDYEITNDDIDQTKCTYVSNIAKFIVVRDNFLSDETIEEEDSPAIQQLIDETVAMRDTLESYALGANEDYNKASQLALQAQSSADEASSSEIFAKESAEIAVANAEASTLSAENAKASEDIAVECKNTVEALTEEVRTDTEFVRTSAQEIQTNTETAVSSANLAEQYKNQAETASQEAVAANAEIQMSKDEIIENINTARELLSNYSTMGDGTKFLSDDGSYKEVGASNQVQADWNQSDSAQNDYIKNRPFYDNTSTKTCSQTVWYGGYLSNVDDWTEIDNDLWQLLLTKNITLSSKLGDFIYVNEYDDTVKYLAPNSCGLQVSKTTNKAYIMGGAPDGVHIDDIELTYEVITEEIKKIDPKFLPEIPQPTMIINITVNDDGTLSADKTFDEISEFYNNGGSVYASLQDLQDQNILIPLVAIDFELGFSAFSVFVPGDVSIIDNVMLSIDTNNNISFKENGYYTLPETNAGDENRFLKGDGTWSELPTTQKTVVNIVYATSGKITSDMTYNEIMNAYNSGSEVIANVSFGSGGGGFIAFLSNTVNYIRFTSLLGHEIIITNDNKISIDFGTYVKYDSIVDNFLEFGRVEEYIPTSDYSPATKKYVDDSIPDKLPNPQKLTFAGAVTAEYDGSGAVTVTIPDSGAERIEKGSTDTAVGLEPNKLYIFPEMAELTITLAEPSDTGIANEYHFVFQSGATATTLSLPEAVKIPSGFTVDANKIYEISILEGCLCAQSWAVS